MNLIDRRRVSIVVFGTASAIVFGALAVGDARLSEAAPKVNHLDGGARTSCALQCGLGLGCVVGPDSLACESIDGGPVSCAVQCGVGSRCFHWDGLAGHFAGCRRPCRNDDECPLDELCNCIGFPQCDHPDVHGPSGACFSRPFAYKKSDAFRWLNGLQDGGSRH